MSDLEHAQKLIAMARSDFKALQGMGDVDQFDDAIFGFHAQQAVEKGLKSWIAMLGKRYPKSHDIDALLDIVEQSSEDVTDLMSLVDLYPFAVQFRYEAIDEEDEPLDRADTLRRVDDLLRRVEKRLPS
ncbi:MAG TPA: HEPN domain-containing protein [Pirellulales bacterium]|jgi:HEPN domain-containing protein|nr:HEPN domain-containing protein [Pirellulales bacterium]